MSAETARPLRGILINSERREIRAFEYTGPEALWAYLGFNPASGLLMPNSDMLLIDSDSMRKPGPDWFIVQGTPAPPFNGNGVVIGRDPATGGFTDCQSSLDQVRQTICFGTPVEPIKKGQECAGYMAFAKATEKPMDRRIFEKAASPLFH